MSAIAPEQKGARLSKQDKMRMHQERNSAQYAQKSPALIEEVFEGEVILSIDCRLIDKNPYQNRTFFDALKINELAHQIKNNGQQQPIALRKFGNRYQIIFGERRWRACMQLPEKNVLAVVREVSDVELAYACYSENAAREKIHDFEKSISLEILQNMGRPKDEIMEKLGLKKQDYYKIIKFLSLPDPIRDFLGGNPHALGRNEAADIEKIYAEFGSEVPDEFSDTAIKLMTDYIGGKIGNRAQIVKEIRAKFTTPMKRNRDKVNKSFELFSGEVRVGELVHTPSEMRFSLNKSEVPQDRVDELQKLITDFLKEI